ncbi:MAG: hypothetical protein AB7I50_15945 [Vicinamibacterales bacterium]
MTAAREPAAVEFIYGAPEFGYRLITRSGGEAAIQSQSWTRWSDVAGGVGADWDEFTSLYEDDLEYFNEERGEDDPITGSTAIYPEERYEIAERFGSSPEAIALRELLDALEGNPRALFRIRQIADFGGGAPGMAFDAVLLDSDEAIAAFQRVLDEEGCTHIKLIRDDEFLRRVFR